MVFLKIFLTVFLTGLLLPVFNNLIYNKNIKKQSQMNIDNFVVKCPFSLVAITSVVVIFFAMLEIALIIFCVLTIYQLFVMVVFLSIFSFLLIAMVREKVIVKGDIIVYTPYFGKDKSYSFNDIKLVRKNIASNGAIGYQIISNRRLFTISNLLESCDLFIEKIKKYNIEIEVEYK